MGRVICFLGAAVCFLTCALFQPAAAACQIKQLAEIQIEFRNNQILVPAEINGEKVSFIWDTGASSSTLFPDAVLRLHLPAHNDEHLRGLQFFGVGGGGEQGRVAYIKQLKLGHIVLSNQVMMVLGTMKAGRTDVVGLLGHDQFSQWDQEVDVPGKALRILQPVGCSPPEMVYWGASYSQVPLVRRDDLGSYTVPVKLNGANVDAELDTGAGASIVTLGAAARAKLTPKSAEVRSIGFVHGLGPTPEPGWVGRFATFTVGDETIRNSQIGMADMFAKDQTTRLGDLTPTYVSMPTMLLGADFFHAHRVLISPSHSMVFFSYAGGPVFETPAADADQPKASPAS